MIALSGRNRLRVAALSVLMLSIMLAPASRSGVSAQDSEIVGRYAAAVTKGDLPTQIPNNSNLLGRWVISFGADGTYAALRQDAGVLESGTYEVDGDQVTITDDGGLLSCAGPIAAYGAEDDASVGVYSWSRTDGGLTLTPVDEPCLFRSVILTSSDLTVFVPCGPDEETTPIATEADAVASPSPTEESGGLLDLLTPEAEVTEPSDQADQGDTGDVETVTGEIDGLLGQLTACWNSGDIDQFLLLLTSGSRDSFLQLFAGDTGETDEDVLRENASMAMRALPSTWERSGDVEITGDNKARAIVRWVLGGDEQFLPSRFEFEDGAWRWDASF